MLTPAPSTGTRLRLALAVLPLLIVLGWLWLGSRPDVPPEASSARTGAASGSEGTHQEPMLVLPEQESKSEAREETALTDEKPAPSVTESNGEPEASGHPGLAKIAGSFLFDDEVLEHEASAWGCLGASVKARFVRPGDNRGVPRRHTYPDQEGEFLFNFKAAGSATIQVYLPGSSGPVLEVRGVDARLGEVTRDPRLQDIDLRGRVGVSRLHVLDTEGRPIEGAEASGWGEPSATGADGRASLLVSDEGLEVSVRCRGYREAALVAHIGDELVTLQRGIAVRLYLESNVDLPGGTTWLGVQLERDLENGDWEIVETRGRDFNGNRHGSTFEFGSDRSVDVLVPRAGIYRYRCTLRAQGKPARVASDEFVLDPRVEQLLMERGSDDAEWRDLTRRYHAAVAAGHDWLLAERIEPRVRRKASRDPALAGLLSSEVPRVVPRSFQVEDTDVLQEVVVSVEHDWYETTLRALAD